MLTAILLSVLGLVLLYFGAEALVKGSSSMGLRLGLTPLVVGLTIVAFGTSAPELAVSLNAAHGGNTDISIGNVVGSNIANIGLILGLSALVRPIHIDIKLIRLDVPLMILVSALLCLSLLDARIGTVDGVLMVTGIIIYTVINVIGARRSQKVDQEKMEEGLPVRHPGLALDIALIIGGLVMLIIGGKFLVDGAVQFARLVGVSEAVIGLTIIAVGTSLPEMATSMLAAARNMSDISVGNIVGSNIFNILAVLGASAMLASLPMGNISWTDMGVMMVFALILIPLMRSGFILQRWEGLLLVGGYAGYVIWLIVGTN